jgi:hypothetical protein
MFASRLELTRSREGFGLPNARWSKAFIKIADRVEVTVTLKVGKSEGRAWSIRSRLPS